MTDILQLPGWEVSGIRLDDGEYIIEATYTARAGIRSSAGRAN